MKLPELRQALKQAPVLAPDKPDIVITGKSVAVLTGEILASLSREQPTRLYLTGSTLVQLKQENDRLFIEPFNRDTLTHWLNWQFTWYRESKTGMTSTNCPDSVVRDILAHSALPFSQLMGITSLPLIRLDGTCQQQSGYDPLTGYYLKISDKYTIEPLSVNKALNILLNDLLGDFPFENEASKANAMALLLLPFVRHLIDGSTPLHLIDAPIPGSGKTLLADVVTTLATGYPQPKTAAPHSREEWQKMLLSVLSESPGLVVMDNFNHKLDSGDLASVLTTQLWKARVLGSTQNRTVGVHCVWIATGNNTVVSTELARRTVHIRLLPKEARPHERQNFKQDDLIGWVKTNRWLLIEACLTLIRHWIESGSPVGTTRFNSYNQYAEILGGILGCAGVPGFLANQEQFYEQADDETSVWEQFTHIWWERYQAGLVTSQHLTNLPGFMELADSLIGTGKTTSQTIRLGKALQRKRDTVFGHYQIKHAGKDSHNRILYRLLARTSGIIGDNVTDSRPI